MRLNIYIKWEMQLPSFLTFKIISSLQPYELMRKKLSWWVVYGWWQLVKIMIWFGSDYCDGWDLFNAGKSRRRQWLILLMMIHNLTLTHLSLWTGNKITVTATPLSVFPTRDPPVYLVDPFNICDLAHATHCGDSRRKPTYCLHKHTRGSKSRSHRMFFWRARI